MLGGAALVKSGGRQGAYERKVGAVCCGHPSARAEVQESL